MYLCKHPIYDKKLNKVAMNIAIASETIEDDQMFDLETTMATLTNSINDSHPLFIPYLYANYFQAFKLSNPIIYIVDAQDIGTKYDMGELSNSTKSMALFIRNVKDLMYLNLVDYVGISIEIIEKNNVKKLVDYIHSKKHKVIVFDITSQAKYRQCAKFAMDYYCGNFLYQPEYEENTISANKINLLNLVNQLQDEDVSFQEVSEIINNDPALSYELLKVANSAALAGNQKIESVQQAVVRMGFLNLKNLVLTIAMKNVSDKPIELIESGLIRAHMCQSIAATMGFDDVESYYTTGLLSIIDILLDKPMDKLLKQTALAEKIRAALLSREGQLGSILKDVISYEQALWDEMSGELEPEIDWSSVYISSMNIAAQTVKAMKRK